MFPDLFQPRGITIGVYRPTVVYDEYNNPTAGPFAFWKSLLAVCSPTKQGDTVEVGRDARITGYNVVIRTPAPTGITDADEIAIAGEGDGETDRFFIDGDIGRHYSQFGDIRAEEFAVKRGVG